MKKAKIMYKGMSLFNYCKENNLPYTCIMQKLKKINTSKDCLELSNEEILEKVVSSYKEHIFKPYHLKYLYNDTSFFKYCQINNLPYSTFIQKIKMLKEYEEYAKLSDDEIIKFILDEYYKKDKISNSYYINTDLVEYCKLNNLSYHYVRQKINELKQDEEFKNYSYEELTEIVRKTYVKEKTPLERTKYYYENKTLFKYCKDAEISYRYVLITLNSRKTQSQYMHLSVDELIDLIIGEYINKQNNEKYYYYEGNSLFNYCKEHKLEYCKLIAEINILKELKGHEIKDINELIKMVIKKDQNQTLSLDENFHTNLISLKEKYQTKIAQAKKNAIKDNDCKVKLKK